MICPVCKRELAPTLSICLTCGAMMNDTVREDLETKIEKLPIGFADEFSSPTPIPTDELEIPELLPLAESVKKVAPVARPEPITNGIGKRDTSPTLIEFQHTNPSIPDWRLQLQNTVRKRTTNGNAQPVAAAPATAVDDQAKAPVSKTNSAAVENGHGTALRSDKMANALKRIEESRRVYSSGAAAGIYAASVAKRKISKTAPTFDVVGRSGPVTNPTVAKAPVVERPKPTLVPPSRIEKKKFDTNKLPPIPEPETPLETEPETNTPGLDSGAEAKGRFFFGKLKIPKISDGIEILETNQPDSGDEIDDLAPFSMRFGAAVFDLIIGGFAAAILLSPFLVSNASLATISGVLAVFGAILVVMFVYMTATIAFVGRTFGMKLFSLEIIDVEENDYPTLHQAAVNSAVYLLSLMLCGIGFIPAFFNEERRAVHDILSGTLLIREY